MSKKKIVWTYAICKRAHTYVRRYTDNIQVSLYRIGISVLRKLR